MLNGPRHRQNHVAGNIMGIVVIPQHFHSNLFNRLFRPNGRPGHRRSRIKQFACMVVDVYIHALFVEVLIVLLKNNSALKFNLWKCRGIKELGKDLHSFFQLRDMRAEPVLRVFPKSGGTKIPTDILEFHIQGDRIGILPVTPE